MECFHKKIKQDTIPFEFEDIVVQVKAFQNPIALSLVLKKTSSCKMVSARAMVIMMFKCKSLGINKSCIYNHVVVQLINQKQLDFPGRAGE
jgi:hypothetical protein